MVQLTLDVRGVERLARKLNSEYLYVEPFRRALEAGGICLERPIKEQTPVDTGRLRNSVETQLGTYGELTATVGTNVTYAPYVELGTRPHWPPLEALTVWARRHGTTPFLVARAIARRGTRGRHMFRDALAANLDRVQDVIRNRLAAEVRARWDS